MSRENVVSPTRWNIVKNEHFCDSPNDDLISDAVEMEINMTNKNEKRRKEVKRKKKRWRIIGRRWQRISDSTGSSGRECGRSAFTDATYSRGSPTVLCRPYWAINSWRMSLWQRPNYLLLSLELLPHVLGLLAFSRWFILRIVLNFLYVRANERAREPSREHRAERGDRDF